MVLIGLISYRICFLGANLTGDFLVTKEKGNRNIEIENIQTTGNFKICYIPKKIHLIL